MGQKTSHQVRTTTESMHCAEGPACPLQSKVGFWISRNCYRIIRIFRLPRRANHWHWSARPAPPRGASARSSRNVARVAMDAAASGSSAAGRNRCSVRRSRVVLAPRPWRLSTPACAGVATVTTNAAHRGEHEVSREAIARGKPGCLGCTCLIRVRPCYPLHTGPRAQSAPGFPCALSSERGTTRLQNSGGFESRE